MKTVFGRDCPPEEGRGKVCTAVYEVRHAVVDHCTTPSLESALGRMIGTRRYGYSASVFGLAIRPDENDGVALATYCVLVNNEKQTTQSDLKKTICDALPSLEYEDVEVTMLAGVHGRGTREGVGSPRAGTTRRASDGRGSGVAAR